MSPMSYAILEGRDAIGGTWDLFRYPGIRSDSDMHTLGYRFKPWREAKAIADGPSIRPEELDYTGQRVVVIGSGATAVTLVPAMTDRAAHVTMLQRSPSYVMARPAEDRIANALRRWLPARQAYRIVRWKNVLVGQFFYSLARRKPAFTRKLIRKGVQEHLGAEYPIDTHFEPRYNPWDERLCLVPDADLFAAIRAGTASVVTDHIDTFTETGIRLRSGEHLEADLVVTATGLNVKLMSGMELWVDGERVELSSALTYKGMMYSDVPNLASAFGYTNASWTLKCDLTSAYVCRLLNHMERNGFDQCTPRLSDPEIEREPALGFTSGYVQRALHALPQQGATRPWRLHQNYALDMLDLRLSDVEDGTMEFRAAPARAHR
jgi:monooxygenase